MMQNELITKKEMAAIGEEIGLELGSKMVKDYQVANPTDTHWYMIGRDIINQILAQPGCVGMKFYNAYDETGEKTLVYVGVNSEGNALFEYTIVNNEGILESQKGIVADRMNRSGRSSDADDWGWSID